MPDLTLKFCHELFVSFETPMKEQKLQSGGNPDLVGLLRLAGSAKSLKKIAKEVEYFSTGPVSLPLLALWVGIKYLIEDIVSCTSVEVFDCPMRILAMIVSLHDFCVSLCSEAGRSPTGFLAAGAFLATLGTPQALFCRRISSIQLQCSPVVDCGILLITHSLEQLGKP